MILVFYIVCEVDNLGSFTIPIVVSVEYFGSVYPDQFLESNMSFIHMSKLLCNPIYQYAMISENQVGMSKALC